MSRFRTYYTGPYKKFMQLAEAVFPKVVGKWKPLACIVAVNIMCYRQQPKKTKLDFPPGDVDNYAKAVMDACNEVVWVDDDQVGPLTVDAAWAPKGEPGRVEMTITYEAPSRRRRSTSST